MTATLFAEHNMQVLVFREELSLQEACRQHQMTAALL